ncbi:MAG: hypothetical protein ACE5NG_19350 [bacterium]
MEGETLKAIVAMVCMTILELYAIQQNIDGTVLAAAIGGLCGLGGYILGKTKKET